MKNILLLLLYLCPALTANLAAQAIWSRDFPFAEELPSNEMTCLYQDQDGFVWVGTTNGLARYDSYHLQIFQTNHQAPYCLSHNHILCLAEDSLNLWVGTPTGLSLINKRTYRISHLFGTQDQTDGIQALCSNGERTVWAGVNDCVICFDTPSLTCDTLRLPLTDGQHSFIHSLTYEKEGKRLWICTRNGIFIYYPDLKALHHLPPVGLKNQPFTLLRDHEGHYWLTTWGEGLWQLIPDRNFRHARYIRQNVTSPRGRTADSKFFSLEQDGTFGYIWAMSYDNLYAFRYDNTTGKLLPVTLPAHIDTGKMYTKILKDRDGNLWLSSYDRGTLLTFHKETIHNYPLDHLRTALNRTPNLLTLNLDSQERFWLIQDRFGLCLYEPKSGHTVFPTPDIQHLTVDARVTATSPTTDGLWIAAPHDHHVYLLNYVQGGFQTTRNIPLTQPDGNHAPATQLEEAPGGALWLHSGQHILYLPPVGEQLYSSPDSLDFTCFTLRNHESVWAATAQHLYILTIKEGRMHCIRQKPVFRNRNNEHIQFIRSDESGGFWASTSLGRILYGKPDEPHFHDLSHRFDTQGTRILNLLLKQQHLWLVSHNRIIHYDTRNHSLQQYTPSDGNMVTPIFRDQATCLSDKGTLHAGGHGGIVSITPPPTATHQAPAHPVVLTDFRSGTHSMLFAPSPYCISGNPDRSNLILPPESPNLSVSFSTLNYAGSEHVRYAYFLKGFDKEWNNLRKGENTAYYQKLPKGSYQLQVKATDTNGQWQKPTTLLSITQLPAWYETTWAYFLYATATLLLLYTLLRLYLLRLHHRNRLQLQETMTQAKLDYFTNISHDLLTPLSVISCVSDYWEQQYPTENRQITILRQNVDRLKRLLRQILDFRKIEKNSLTLHPEQGDIFGFARQLCINHFAPLAEQKGLRLNLHIPEGTYFGSLDFDKADKILYNLLSNAIKYTPKGKNVDFIVEIQSSSTTRKAVFTIQDEGAGIPPKEQKRIFERFYTGSNGRSGQSNGIGLALVRELTELHHGHIDLKSETGKGSRFCVTLPLDWATDTADRPADYILQTKTTDQQTGASLTGIAGTSLSAPLPDNTRTQPDNPVILLIDDNIQLLDMMEKTLCRDYTILRAENGKEALERIHGQDIDLAVSDVMMPVMDGLSLCRKLKSQIETSHIPIIMLTAKQSPDDKVDCYAAGANGYLAKPFEMKVLAALIDNLIRTHRNRQQSFRLEDHIRLAELEYAPDDTRFLQNMADFIHAHLAEESFGLEQLAGHLHISKSTLHRKVKAMTGLTPLEFIRNIKLKYACDMLRHRRLTIAEVAYATGFSSPKYFTKCFKDEFKLTPSEYQEKEKHG